VQRGNSRYVTASIRFPTDATAPQHEFWFPMNGRPQPDRAPSLATPFHHSFSFLSWPPSLDFAPGFLLNRASCCKQFKFLIGIGPHATEQPFARLLQTSADSTQLVQQVPDDASTPFSVKLHEDSFRAYNTDIPSLDVEVTEDSLLKMYKQMVTMRRMEQSADALYKSKLICGVYTTTRTREDDG